VVGPCCGKRDGDCEGSFLSDVVSCLQGCAVQPSFSWASQSSRCSLLLKQLPYITQVLLAPWGAILGQDLTNPSNTYSHLSWVTLLRLESCKMTSAAHAL